MAAHSRLMTDFLTRTEILTENSESAAPEPPQNRIPLSPDAEKREREKTILYKEVSDRNDLLNFPGFLLLIKLASCYMHSDICSAVKLVRTTPIIDML